MSGWSRDEDAVSLALMVAVVMVAEVEVVMEAEVVVAMKGGVALVTVAERWAGGFRGFTACTV